MGTKAGEVQSKGQKNKLAKGLRDATGPVDPLAERRQMFDDSDDPMDKVCFWIARAWREIDAIEIADVDHAEWGKWKQLNPERFKTAMRLGGAMVFAEMRGIALGVTGQRGQGYAQKAVIEQLDGGRRIPKPTPRIEGGKAWGNPGDKHDALDEFNTDELEEIAYGDNGNRAP